MTQVNTRVRPVGQDLKINCPIRRTLLKKKLERKNLES